MQDQCTMSESARRGGHPALDNTLFVRNMKELWRFDPAVALELDRINDEELPPIEQTKTEAVTLRRTTPDGRQIYLHSRYNPIAEAEKWTANAIEEDKFCYIVEGFGLGYHIKELFQQLTGDVIVAVIEPDLHALRLALTHLDFTEEIESKCLVMLTRPDKSHVHQRLEPYQAYILMGAKIVSHQPSVQISSAFFHEMQTLCMAFIEYTKTAVVTLVTNAQTTCRNVANNFATYLATPPIDELRSRFSGFPAIVVSAGPSLKKNMHHLADAKGKAVIIAVQSTLKPLFAAGIVPDFVCSLDYHELSRQFYEGIDDFQDVHLVAEPKAHHSVIDAFGGPVSLLNSSFAQTCLADAHGSRDGLRAGASVAHLAFYLAEYMECNPIVMVGQDLALTDHVYHAPGMPIHEVWRGELNRFCTMEMKEWERIVRSKPMLRKIKNCDGEDVYTEDLMFNYLEQFEKDIARSAGRIIDATEGGARIQGCELMTLREVINQNCTRPIDPALFAYRRRKPWFDPAPLEAGRVQIEARLDEIGKIEVLCDETMEILDELKALVDQPTEFNKKIKKVDRLRLKVREPQRAYSIIQAGAQLAEFRKFSADQRLKASGAEGQERARKQLDRDQEFVRAMKADAERMRIILENAQQRIRQKMDHFASMEESSAI